MINEKIIDTHLHIEAWENGEYPSFTDCFEGHKKDAGLHTVNICAVGSAQTLIANNIMVGFYKLLHPDTYVHGGVNHFRLPTEEAEKGLDLVTQYRELMAIGFDGIKMLEGKANLYKLVNTPLDSDYYDAFFAACEADNTHVLAHINDPEEFWDERFATDELKAKGWFYGDGTYIKNTEMYAQIDHILEKHPALKITFAHFFFRSANPEILETMFAKYPNVAVDLTPGGEMYVNFNKRPAYYKRFFHTYSDRIVFGTDGSFPKHMDEMTWLCDRVFRYVATDDETEAWGDTSLTGIALNKWDVERIMAGNFLRRVGEAPKPINKDALRAYIAKYKDDVQNEATRREIERLAAEWL